MEVLKEEAALSEDREVKGETTGLGQQSGPVSGYHSLEGKSLLKANLKPSSHTKSGAALIKSYDSNYVCSSNRNPSLILR